MKKAILPAILLVLTLPALASCKSDDYTSYISEARSDLFVAETEEFSLSVACVSREYPYVADGVSAPKSDVVEITLKDKINADGYEVYLVGEREIGGETSYRSVSDDYFFSEGVSEFPKESVCLRVEWGDEARELTATSVKNENTLSVPEALNCVLSFEATTIQEMTQNGIFHGEFYIRLLRREKNFYYVGIIDREGNTISLLLDGESGELLARRESN